MKRTFLAASAVCVFAAHLLLATPSAAQQAPAAGTIAEIIGLLKELGYVPGQATDKIDTDTDYALTLYVKADQPQDLAGVKGPYDQHLAEYRDSLRAGLARRKEADGQPEIFVETPHGRSGAKLNVNLTGTAALSSDGASLKSWDVATGRQTWTAPLSLVIASSPTVYTTIAVTADGRHALAAHHAIRVYDNQTGKTVRTFWSRTRNGQASTITRMAARPNSTELVTDDLDGRVVVYDWGNGQFVAELGRHEKMTYQGQAQILSIDQIEVSPDGRFAASVGTDFGVRVWDLAARRQHRFFAAPNGVSFDKVAFFDNGRKLAASVKSISLNRQYRNDVFLFDVDNGQSARLPYTDVFNLEAATDGGLVIQGTTPEKDSYGIHIYDRRGSEVSKLPSASSERIVAGRTFEFENGWLKILPVTQERKYEGRLPSPGLAGFVREADRSALRLFGNGDGIFAFDAGSGAVEMQGKLTVPKNDEPWYIGAFATPKGDILATTQSDTDSDNVWVPSRLHGQGGALKCFQKVRGTPVGEYAAINGFDYSSALDLTAYIFNGTIYLHRGTTCEEVKQIPLGFATSQRGKLNWPSSPLSIGLRFSADGKTLYAWRAEAGVQSFDPVSGQRKQVYSTDYGNGPLPDDVAKVLPNLKKNGLLPLVYNVVAIPGSKQFAAIIGGNVYTLNAYSGGLILIFEEGNPKFVASYRVSGQPDRWSIVDPAGKSWLMSLSAFGVSTIDVRTGAHQSGFGKQPSSIEAMAFSPDGRLAFILAGDGVLRTYMARSGELLLTTAVTGEGGWLSITPEGFFASASGGERAVRVKNGTALFDIDQFYQALYRPDLVREKLSGDPRGLVRRAAADLDLGKALASGIAPEVKLTLQGGAGGASASPEAEIADRGGGIGRIEWRVNGVTAGVDTAATQPQGAPVRLTRQLALDPGSNSIEVVAYNGANLIASTPARLTVAGPPAAPQQAAQQTPAAPAAPAATKPRLFAIVAGVNDYADARIKLSYSVSDAKEIARGLQEAAGNLYQAVEVKLMTDADVNRGRLDAAFAETAAKASASDVFVLYLAGHGKTLDGRYYFIPQAFAVDGELNNQSIATNVKQKGIAQDQWQRWFASIPARKSVILFDTCDSGTLTGEEAETQPFQHSGIRSLEFT